MPGSARKKEAKGININLMPGAVSKSPLGSVVQWVLTVGRYLIIATEIIALATFALSFKLTLDKNNLQNRIVEAQVIVDSKAEFETTFREVQSKFSNIKVLQSKHFDNHLVTEEFTNLLPKGISLTSLSIDGDKLTFSGAFPTAAQLHTLINSFNKSDKIVDLNISELSSPSEKDPNFAITASATVNAGAFSIVEEPEPSPEVTN